jgi:hypothetical protein
LGLKGRKFYLGDEIMEGEIGSACSTHAGEEICIVFWWGNMKGRNYLEGLGVDEGIILKWVLQNNMQRCELDLSCSEQGQMVDCCERSNEPSGSIKCEEFLS